MEVRPKLSNPFHKSVQISHPHQMFFKAFQNQIIIDDDFTLNQKNHSTLTHMHQPYPSDLAHDGTTVHQHSSQLQARFTTDLGRPQLSQTLSGSASYGEQAPAQIVLDDDQIVEKPYQRKRDAKAAGEVL